LLNYRISGVIVPEQGVEG
jgi:predicted lipid-binding transport protein (Tim44 family)